MSLLTKIIIVPVAVLAVLAPFVFPNADSEPHDLPIGVAGDPEQAGALEQKLAQQDGAFEVHRYADEAAAVDAIEDRDVYGAVAMTREGPKVLTASAASFTVSLTLEKAAAQAAAEAGAKAPAPAVVDVVSADDDDPSGRALSSSIFPLLVGGMLTGYLITTIRRSASTQVAALLAASVLGGLAGVAVLQGWLDVLGGDWVANAGVLGLMILSVGALAAGAAKVMGNAGTAAAAFLIMFIGNPWSGMSSAPEMLPSTIGDIGQALPPGAGGNALRSTAFFDGAAAGGHLSVLIAWSVVGLALVGIAEVRRRALAVDPDAKQPIELTADTAVGGHAA
jgi:hypothetical protein